MTRVRCPRWSRFGVTFLGWLILLGSTNAAAAVTPDGVRVMRPLVGAQELPYADGRWAAVTDTGGMLVLEARGRELVQRRIDLGRACEAQFGTVAGVGGGYAVIECAFSVGDVGPRLLVINLRTGSAARIPGTQSLQGSDGHTITGVGRHWIAFSATGHRGGALPGLLRWRDGTTIPRPTRAGHVVDLNAPTGTRKICRGVHLPQSRRESFAYRPPYAFVTQQRGRRLILQRCSGRPRILVSDTPSLRRPVLSSGWAAWIDGQRITARSLKTDRRIRFRSPTSRPAGLSVSLVGQHLLATHQGGPFGGERGFAFTIYHATLPR
jgi:hypothetical protein